MPAMPQSSDVRIAKNTVIIYIRMIVTILVGLITSRLVLQVLGASDVGVYSAVGSAVAFVGVVTSALSSTTVRFMNIEIGSAGGNPNRMFNICNTIHLCGAAFILILLETIGIWYIRTKLVVPEGKEFDAMFVFQISVIVACLGISNVPYQGLFTVYEKFSISAVIDIIITLLKFGLVVLLFLLRARTDCLRIFAVFMGVVSGLSFLTYYIVCIHLWPDIVRWKFVGEKSAYKKAIVFSNYNLLHSSSMIARSQGSNMLINAFFGTTINAAFYYASTLQNYVNQFVNNFDTAAAPQITQNVGAGQNLNAVFLSRRVCRICLILFLLFFFPLWSELDFIMWLWLGSKMPPETILMARWTLIIAAVSTTSSGLAQLINAFGRIKWYKIEISVLYLLCLPAGYILFRNGFPAWSILCCFVLADILNRIIQFILLYIQFQFDVFGFFGHAYFRPLVISCMMVGYLWVYRSIEWTGIWGHLGGFFITFFLTAVVVAFVGFTQKERKKALDFVKLKINLLTKKPV